MSRNYKYKNRGTNWTAVIVTGIIAVLIAAILTVGIGSEWFRQSDPSKWFGRGEVITPAEPDDESGTADGMTVTAQSTERLRMTARAVNNSEQFPNADNKYVVTATVKPTDADDSELNWSVKFKDGATGWAQGKTVSDYVSVTSVSSDTKRVEVTCHKAFGAVIEVVATSKSTPEVTASCVCNYLERVTNFNFELPALGCGELDCNVTYDRSVCTIKSEMVLNDAYVYLTSEFENYVINQVDDLNRGQVSGVAGAIKAEYDAANGKINFVSSPRRFFFIDMGDGFQGDGDDEQALYDKLSRSFRDSVLTYTGVQAKVVFSYTLSYDGYEFETKEVRRDYRFDYELVKQAVTDIELDPDGGIMM